MGFEESKKDQKLAELTKKVDRIEKTLDRILKYLEKVDTEKMNKIITYQLYDYEKRLRDEDRTDKIINTLLKGRFQACEVCGRFKFIEHLTNKHAICESCLHKYIDKGMSLEGAKAKERKK